MYRAVVNGTASSTFVNVIATMTMTTIASARAGVQFGHSEPYVCLLTEQHYSRTRSLAHGRMLNYDRAYLSP